MRTIYIDTEFMCHTTGSGSAASVETDFFDGKCDEYIAGFRFVPDGMEWVREDGKVFKGEMISAWKDYAELAWAQMAHERQLPADAEVL